MKQTLYLFRHGHTSGTDAGLFYGATELPVTEKGLEEIRAMAETGLYPDPAGSVVYTSGMYRTEQTLQAMYGEVEHEQEPLLKEINLGKFEMMTVTEILQDEYGRQWLEGKLDDPVFEGGDSHTGFDERVNRGIRKVIDKAADDGAVKIIVVAHGAVITYIMNRFFPGVYEDIWKWCPNPGTGFMIGLTDGEAVSWEPVGDTEWVSPADRNKQS